MLETDISALLLITQTVTEESLETSSDPGFLQSIGAHVYWIASVVGAIGLSVIANLVTDPVKNFMARNSTQATKERIKEIKKELTLLETLKDNSDKKFDYFIRKTLRAFMYLVVAEGIHSSTTILFHESELGEPLGLILYFSLACLYCIAFFKLGIIVETSSQLIDWEEYRKEQEALLIKLQRRHPL